jgi:nitrile hydratase
VNGIHDMGGMHGFGRVEVEPHEPVFHAPWEGRVLGMAFMIVGRGWATIDAFRHGIERMDPVAYLTAGYYGRWLASLETVLVDTGLLARSELDARLQGATPGAATTAPQPPAGAGAAGFIRTVDVPPRFAVGDAVQVRNLHPCGHTRLPGYVRGRRGVVARVHPACVFPDTNAHGLGEKPQYVYSVRFPAAELWGEQAEAGAVVHVDLFEDYLG